MPELSLDQIERFLKKVMEIQEEFAHEKQNARASRQAKLREWLDQHAGEEVQ